MQPGIYLSQAGLYGFFKMKQMRNYRYLSILLFLPVLCGVFAESGHCQDKRSSPVLTEEGFLEIVRVYHPVARQANLLVDRARAEMVAARAGFDPYFYLQSERKTFDGKEYYNYFNPEIKIPTWYGVEISAGLEENLGTRVDPEYTVGQSSYLGVSVPLAKNLLMDKRRAVLQQAKIFREQSKFERSLVLNDLLYEASLAYWNWALDYRVYGILSDAVRVNEDRLRLVRIGHQQGDRPAIDTTEALAQLQSFELARNEAWLAFRKAGFELSNFLWQANDSPYYLPAGVRPDSAWAVADLSSRPLPVLEELVTQALREHPKLQVYDFKLRSLDIERRLKMQDLLPMVNLKYNILNSGYNVFNDGNAAFYRNNYKFGIDIGVPLRLSQGRGQYQASLIKITETGLDRSLVRLAISNKVSYHFNELAMLQKQIVIAEDNLSNYMKLLRGEELRFGIGETSLFFVNSRENKVLDAKRKLAELRMKYFTSLQSIRWAMGQMR